jgi:hypothetical protein
MQNIKKVLSNTNSNVSLKDVVRGVNKTIIESGGDEKSCLSAQDVEMESSNEYDDNSSWSIQDVEMESSNEYDDNSSWIDQDVEMESS